MLTKKKQPLPAVMMAAIGVVYGDIGTSPLYTLRECFSNYYGFQTHQDVIFGFLSLIFWMLILIVSIKYITFVMRADNSGEGGILTLMSLATRHTSKRVTGLLILFGLVGASFFYGEVVITPAVSVMSAIEGLEIAAPSLETYVVPCSIVILTILFIIQRKGTGSVGKLFSPIMLLWFIVIAVLGIKSIIETPIVLEALNPKWAIMFFVHYKSSAVLALGATVLAITGVEALYADMGHFGRSSIRYSWFSAVLPALVLNYFGQGALLLRDPTAIKNPFFLLAPSWGTIPLLILATLAAVIASQAVIAGVFSLTRQAIHMGFLTPMRIVYTSEKELGQIYIPFVNWLLYIAVVIVVVAFKHSSHLAAAYGIAVTGTMVLTGILFCVTSFKNWRWPLVVTSILLIIMLIIDVPMFSANVLKIFSGGWLPLVIGLFVFIIMLTWRTERLQLTNKLNERANSLDAMIASLEKNPPQRVPGTAVYMARNPLSIPLAFVYNLRHNKVLHERVFMLTLRMKDEPYVHNVQRVEIEQLSNSFWRVVASYGFKETPNMEEIFYRCGLEGLPCRLMESSFFMSDQTLINNERPWYLRVRGRIFIMLYRNALRAADQFEIPPDRVIELGSQIEI